MCRTDAIQIFNAGVNAVKPGALLPQYISVEGGNITIGNAAMPLTGINGIYLLSVGKAACAMAAEVERNLGERLTAGLVITKYGHSLPLQYCNITEAGHPVPDENSVAAAQKVKHFLQQVKSQSLLLCCISGGASSLLGDLADGITLDDMQQLSKSLLQCGATIHEINTVRKHLSTFKGGRLVQQANGANISSLIISDVLGDDISVIASGLTVADTSTFTDAWRILEQYNFINVCPLPIVRHIINGMQGKVPETPKPGEALFNKVVNNIIASNDVALQAALLKAQQLGYHAVIINSKMHGDAEAQAKQFVTTLLAYNGPKPACLLMGGETTVTIKGSGKGGRNQHFVLAALQTLLEQNIPVEKMPVILSGGTDGTDGPTDATGAFIDEDIVQAMQAKNLRPLPYLENNDAYNLFNQLGALLITGPTQTNVMDVVIGLIH